MNKVELIGRLTRDPDVRHNGSGDSQKTVARYTLAVDRRYRKDDEDQNADFIRCVAFGKTAEFAEKYFYKGIKIAITGRIQTGSYQNQDGQTVYTTDVVVEEQEFTESKAASQSSRQEGTAAKAQDKGQTGKSRDDLDDFMTLPDEIEGMEFPFDS